MDVRTQMSEFDANLRLGRLRDLLAVSAGTCALLTQEPARSELSQFIIRHDENGNFQATKTDPRPDGWGTSYEIRFKDADYSEAAHLLLERTTRLAIVESFNIVRAFSYGRSTWNELKHEPWYDVTRLYRNAVAHDGNWQFKESDLQNMPIRLMGLELTPPMVGTSITGFFNLYQAKQLLSKMSLFVLGHRNLH